MRAALLFLPVLGLTVGTACASFGETFRACGCSRGQICVMDPFDGALSEVENAEQNGTCREVPADCSNIFVDDVLAAGDMTDECRTALCEDTLNVSRFSVEGGEHLARCNYDE